MKIIQNFFREYDLFSAPATLRIHEEAEMKSCLIGFISFGVIGAFFYVFVTSMLDVVNYNSVDVSMQETMISGNDAQGQIKMLGVSLDYMPAFFIDLSFDFYFNYYKDGVQIERTKMTPCTPEQWVDLGENYNQTFNEKRLSNFYCQNMSTPYSLNKTLSEQNPTYISITLQTCDQSTRSDCFSSWMDPSIFLTSSSQVYIYIMDYAVYPTEKNSTGYYLNIDARTTLTTEIFQASQILLSSFRIQTDTNIFPFHSIDVVNGTMYSSIKKSPSYYSSAQVYSMNLTEVNIGLNRNMRIYTRSIGKIDNVASYVGGLFGTIVGFASFFLLSFNKYRFEIKVAEGAFNFDKGVKKIKESDFNFFTYIKYTIYEWIKILLCRKIKWKSCNDIDEVREQINSQMDTSRILLRFHKLQTAINYKIQKDEINCINLLEPSSIIRTREQRLKLDYYDQVINHEPVTTMQDIEKQKQMIILSQRLLKNKQASMESLQIVLDQQNPPWNVEHSEKNREMVEQSLQNMYGQAKTKAQSIQLNSEFLQIEKKLAIAYFNLSIEEREAMQMKIPLIILFRLHKILQEKESIKLASNQYDLNSLLDIPISTSIKIFDRLT